MYDDLELCSFVYKMLFLTSAYKNLGLLQLHGLAADLSVQVLCRL